MEQLDHDDHDIKEDSAINNNSSNNDNNDNSQDVKNKNKNKKIISMIRKSKKLTLQVTNSSGV